MYKKTKIAKAVKFASAFECDLDRSFTIALVQVVVQSY